MKMRKNISCFVDCDATNLNLQIIGLISTPSHREDSVSVILDDGNCIVGDLEPVDFLSAYEDNPRLEKRLEPCYKL